MAYQRNPSDPTRSDLANDPYRAGDPSVRDPAQLDNDLQVDPELAEGRASSGRIAVYALAIAVVLGAVFYGLNTSSNNNAGTTASNPQSTAQSAPPAAPPGMRDVTPHHANSQPGTTTGAAPAHPQTPPPAAAPANSAAPAK